MTGDKKQIITQAVRGTDRQTETEKKTYGYDLVEMVTYD